MSVAALYTSRESLVRISVLCYRESIDNYSFLCLHVGGVTHANDPVVSFSSLCRDGCALFRNPHKTEHSGDYSKGGLNPVKTVCSTSAGRKRAPVRQP